MNYCPNCGCKLNNHGWPNMSPYVYPWHYTVTGPVCGDTTDIVCRMQSSQTVTEEEKKKVEK